MALSLDASKLIAAQLDRIGQVSRIFKNFKKDAASRKTKVYCEQRLKRLEDLNQEFNQCHSTLAGEIADNKHDYFASNYSEEFEESILDVICAITECLQAQTTTSNTTSTTNAAPAATQQLITHVAGSTVKLPKLPIPSFSGSFVEWPAFYDAFKRLIHSNGELNNMQKFHFLKEALPNSEMDIKQMSLTDNNYTTAWELIVKRYNNPRLLFMHHMNELFKLPTLQKERSEDIKSVLNVAKVCSNELTRLDIPISTCDHWLAYQVTTKLPQETLRAYEHHLGDSTEIPTFTKLESFLNNRLVGINVLENRNALQAAPAKSGNDAKKSTYTQSNASRKTHHATAKPDTHCTLCNETHVLRRCPVFLAKDCFARQSIAKAQKACFNCLSTAHQLSKCTSTKNCQQCGQRHHTTLHGTEPTAYTSAAQFTSKPSAPRNTSVNVNAAQLSSHVCLQPGSPKVLLATALVRVINDRTGEEAVVRVLVDPGSEGTLISETIVQQLNIQRVPVSIKISGIGNSGASTSKYKINCSLRSLHNKNFVVPVEGAYVLSSLTTNLPSQRVKPQQWMHILGLPLADPYYYQPRRVDMILGVDMYAQIIQSGVQVGSKEEPIAQNTHLGWILSGSLNSSEPLNSFHIKCNVSTIELERLVQRFYEQEQVPEIPSFSNEEEWCENFFKETHQRQKNGKYLVRLPLKSIFDPTQTLGRSRQIAFNRFFHLERKLQRNVELHTRYKACIDEYFALNQITPATTTEKQHCVLNQLSKPTVSSCVLPHHAVFKEDSVTTKLRIVFDASCKTTNGRSLNDILCVGPPLQNDLVAVVMNWRFRRYVFTADIQKMYRCIDMHPDDYQYQRILWRADGTTINEFCLTTVTFGTASAPYTAIRVLHQLADDESTRHPLAAQVLKEEIYVDDVLTGHHQLETALRIRDDVNAALASAGMFLRKFASNIPELLGGIPADHLSHADLLQFNDTNAIKTLGIGWHPKTDVFKLTFNAENDQRATKRTVLSNTFKLFDPLGFISPIVVIAKILLKDIWMTKISNDGGPSHSLDWDDILPDELSERWLTCFKYLQKVKELSIPRWVEYSPDTIKTAQLHVFSDGSKHTYAAAAYLRFEYDDKVTSHLLMSKCRVTPAKELTIPRIELCGALLAAQLSKWIIANIHFPGCSISTHFWTDAQIVLYWIRGTSTKKDIYVSNRINKINELSHPSQWRHVASQDNPVDCATKGLSPEQLIHFPLWWNGPPWLVAPENRCPMSSTKSVVLDNEPIMDTDETLCVNFSICTNSIIFRYSSLTKLLAVAAYVFRFRFNSQQQHKTCRLIGSVSVTEWQNTLFRIVLLVQAENFGTEIAVLKANKPLSNSSKIKGLTPFIDQHGLLRVGGRLRNSAIEYSRKHPILLPAIHHFSKLVIEDAHIRTLHGGPQLTIATIRQRFWIVDSKRVVPQQIRKCVICFRNKPIVTAQLMGDLPYHRVNPPARPFMPTGVDYTGAIELKSSRF